VAEGTLIKLHGLDGYIAQSPKPVGGALLLPMIYGINGCVKDLANRMADYGLTTVICNPYPGHPTIPREEARKRAQQLNDQSMIAQISAWLTYLQNDRKLRQVATIGLCLGGRIGLLHAATDRRVACHVCYYPTIESPKAPNQDMDVFKLAAEIRCPVQIIQPAKDQRTTPETYQKIRIVLQTRHAAPTSVNFYPDADHGFMEVEHHPGHANEVAARLSWPLALAFMRTCVSYP
jgi:carboxymethylenebutenolidase